MKSRKIGKGREKAPLPTAEPWAAGDLPVVQETADLIFEGIEPLMDKPGLCFRSGHAYPGFPNHFSCLESSAEPGMCQRHSGIGR